MTSVLYTDRAALLDAVKANGAALEFASIKLRADSKCVRQAVLQVRRSRCI